MYQYININNGFKATSLFGRYLEGTLVIQVPIQTLNRLMLPLRETLHLEKE